MIGALTGKVLTTGRNPLILMVSGVGYAVYVPTKLIGNVTRGQTRTLYIYTHVRDDALDLFGFATIEELDLFKLLLNVPGVGPRIGLSVIDQGAAAVMHAVYESDVDFFQGIPRLGKKNAQKIIIELKGKLGGIGELDLTGKTDSETKVLLDALTGMGFEKSEASSALRKVNRNISLEQQLKEALKLLAKK